MEQLLQVIFSGVSQGGVYALIGMGFSLVMMSSKILNLAHGAFVLYGGFLFLSLAAALGAPPLLLVPVVLLLVMLLGLGTERVLNFRSSPWQQVSIDATVLLTLALLVVFEGIAFVAWGPDPRRGPPLHPGVLTVGGAVIVWLVNMLIHSVLKPDRHWNDWTRSRRSAA